MHIIPDEVSSLLRREVIDCNIVDLERLIARYQLPVGWASYDTLGEITPAWPSIIYASPSFAET